MSPPWLYLEAGHISTLAIPGGWPYLFPGYTWRLAISPPWLYLEAGHISTLAGVHFDTAFGGNLLLGVLVRNRWIFLLI